jgi:pimeloyl-ACP methyl ester carboxylesterase
MWRLVLTLAVAGCGAASMAADAGGDGGLPLVRPSSDGAGADLALPPPSPSGCIDDPSAGDHRYTCDGIVFDVAVPAACVSASCGLVVDVHGFTMSGRMEDDNTDMRALGHQYGYVVVQPNANPAPPLAAWNPATDDDKVWAFMQLAISVFRIDGKRVHFTGFSQGGFMTFRFLCKHSDALASVAPAAGNAFFTATNNDPCWQNGVLPAKQIPVLYMHGTKDALVAFSTATRQRDAIVAAWKMDAGTMVASDGQYLWTRYANPDGVVFEFLQHDYAAQTALLGGHCFPGSADLAGGQPGQLFGFACVPPSAFTWGEAAMKFFVAHPGR